MDELTTNRAFLHVVESGSFSAAARELNIAVTSVARQVSSLESRLGVQLLNRTTRKHSLTEPGRIYYNQINDIMRQYDCAKREVASYQKSVKGCLRVHLRTSIGTFIIVPALPRFLAKNSDVTLDVTLTDERADLVALGIDVAVWLGELEDFEHGRPAPDPRPAGGLCEPRLYQPRTAVPRCRRTCTTTTVSSIAPGATTISGDLSATTRRRG